MNANLLTDEVFGAELTDGDRRRLSLPALLAGLAAGSVTTLTGPQHHQRDAAHMFLCYLAAAVLDQAGRDTPQGDEAFWRDGLRQITARDDDHAWTLVVDDFTAPAFMQPPIPDQKSAASFKFRAHTPDELDVLQTAKNHDLKRARATSASAEAWALTLLSAQTASGFLGRGNYGVSRMNGGFGCRVCVATMTELGASPRWRQDVQRLLSGIDRLLRPARPYRRDGVCLLWLPPWDGKTGLGMSELHPFFIEICRRYRLTNTADGIVAVASPADAARIIVPDEVRGDMGDAWTPIRRADRAALTVSGQGFTPERLRDLVLTHQDYEPAPMQALAGEGTSAWFHASVLVRGQGTTDGYHEARIYIPAKAKRLLLAGGAERDRLATISEWALDRARDVRARALRPALFALLEGGPDGWPDTKRREMTAWVDTWTHRYDAFWSEGYFPWLWSAVDAADSAARTQWLRRLTERAQAVIDTALDAAPRRSGRRYRARVRARGLFDNAIHRHFAEELRDVQT